ncbi:hypothetical protein EKG40_16225 [Pseudomonas moorei]|nr:hypothetical protein EKG40_16225 [Pseudomonas moorei]
MNISEQHSTDRFTHPETDAKPVGASLLAMALDQATFMSPDKPFSRAGSLPKGKPITTIKALIRG